MRGLALRSNLAVGLAMSASLAVAGDVDPAVAKLFEDRPTATVIVHLEAPPAAEKALSPHRPIPEERLRAIDAAVDDLESTIDSNGLQAEIVERLQLQPVAKVRLHRDALEALAALPKVRRIEPERFLRAHMTEALPLIGAPVAHQLGWTGAGVGVAVIDTGIDQNHPALGGAPAPNGKVVRMLDTADDDDDATDCGTHGTAVSAIAAGLPTTAPAFAGGVAPDAWILSYKVFPSPGCETASNFDISQAIEDVLQHRDEFNVRAINMSLGGSLFAGPCDAITGTLRRSVVSAVAAGITVVTSAGNDADKEHVTHPACLSNVVSVGATYDAFRTQVSWEECTDIAAAALEPTCFSNSSVYLDMLAPGALITSAQAGGGLLTGGGTSFASPMVAGAVALMAEAVPGLTPVEARFRMLLTGLPVTDPENLLTKPFLDVAAAIATVDDAVGDASNLPIPNPGSVTSFATLSAPGRVRHVEVLVKIVHENPDNLLVTLTSPDGTTIVLHDHGPGTTTSPGLGSDGLFVHYPVERDPVEPLAAFHGEAAAGSWALEVLDDDPQVSVGINPALIGWGISLDLIEGPAPVIGPSLLVPVAVHTPGALGTFWITDLRLLNPTEESVSARLFFVPEGEDGSEEFDLTTLTIPPGDIADLPDLVLQWFDLQDVQGTLLIEPGDPAPLVGSSRTYNSGAAGGTYGQYIAPVRRGQAIGSGEGPLYLLQMAKSAGFRSNVGFSEMAGAATEVELEIRRGADGALLGTLTRTVPPFSNVQLNRVLETLGIDSTPNAFGVVRVISGGVVVAYASVVDNQTGDAIYVPGVPADTIEEVVVPVVAKVLGAAGTSWRSDVRIFNGGPAAETVVLTYRTYTGGQLAEEAISEQVPAGKVLAIDDVVGALGRDGESGTLTVEADDGSAELVVTSRTYNATLGGTYGQFVPAVANGSESATVLHLERSNAFRSNLGIAELSGSPAAVTWRLRDGSGALLGTRTVELEPHELVQVNDLFGAVGAGDRDNARVDIIVTSGPGAVAAYGSVVDNRTGDAIFVPAQPLP